MRNSDRGTELFYQRKSPPKSNLHQQRNEPSEQLKSRKSQKPHLAVKVSQKYPGLIPKDEEAAKRMANLTRVLHQMLNMKDHVDAEAILQGIRVP